MFGRDLIIKDQNRFPTASFWNTAKRFHFNKEFLIRVFPIDINLLLSRAFTHLSWSRLMMGRYVVKGCRDTKMKMHYVRKSNRARKQRRITVIFSEMVNWWKELQLFMKWLIEKKSHCVNLITRRFIEVNYESLTKANIFTKHERRHLMGLEFPIVNFIAKPWINVCFLFNCLK